MNLPIATLLICCVLPLVWAWVSSYYRYSQFGGIDNKEPRIQCEKLTGAGARAVAAQANAWEALAVYAAALLAVTASGVSAEQYSYLLWIFIAARVAHGVTYLINQDIIRSLSFIVGYGICIYMFVLAL